MTIEHAPEAIWSLKKLLLASIKAIDSSKSFHLNDARTKMASRDLSFRDAFQNVWKPLFITLPHHISTMNCCSE